MTRLRTMPGVPTFTGSEGVDSAEAEQRRFVVCGDNPLALRLVDELATRYGGEILAIVPSAKSGYGPRIASLPGVEVLEAGRLDAQAFLRAELASVAALALVDQDDGGNLDAALLARELNPDVGDNDTWSGQWQVGWFCPGDLFLPTQWLRLSPGPSRSTRVRCSASSLGRTTVSSPGSSAGAKKRCTRES